MTAALDGLFQDWRWDPPRSWRPLRAALSVALRTRAVYPQQAAEALRAMGELRAELLLDLALRDETPVQNRFLAARALADTGRGLAHLDGARTTAVAALALACYRWQENTPPKELEHPRLISIVEDSWGPQLRPGWPEGYAVEAAWVGQPTLEHGHALWVHLRGPRGDARTLSFRDDVGGIEEHTYAFMAVTPVTFEEVERWPDPALAVAALAPPHWRAPLVAPELPETPLPTPAEADAALRNLEALWHPDEALGPDLASEEALNDLFDTPRWAETWRKATLALALLHLKTEFGPTWAGFHRELIARETPRDTALMRALTRLANPVTRYGLGPGREKIILKSDLSPRAVLLTTCAVELWGATRPGEDPGPALALARATLGDDFSDQPDGDAFLEAFTDRFVRLCAACKLRCPTRTPTENEVQAAQAAIHPILAVLG